MRMSPRDIADVTGATYSLLINGHSTADNWNAVFSPGVRVRLRIINASAMTLFNVRMPGLPMTIVQGDGLNVQPLEVDKFQMGVAEIYDVIIQPKDDRAYAFVAESIDRSGQAVATFATSAGVRAEAPSLRPVPTLTMKDMGIGHFGMPTLEALSPILICVHVVGKLKFISRGNMERYMWSFNGVKFSELTSPFVFE